MERDVVLRQLAPCGIDCGRCVRFRDGATAQAAQELAQGLEGFAAMAARMAPVVPALAGYTPFEAVLKVLAGADCTGCRNGSANCLPTCTVKTCFREKGVDFCGECREFPCTQKLRPETLHQSWLDKNRRIQEIGAEAYYQEQRKQPRY